SIRQWSEFITIQPYFLGRKQNGDPRNSVTANRKPDMDIYAPGLRVYGLIGQSGFDYDADINKQFGRFGVLAKNGNTQTEQQHDALAYSLELGYTFDHDWKPRVSAYYGFGTGDKNPNDGSNERFDAFFGFNQPWSRNDYFSWDNIHAPKARLEITPHADVRIDAGYNAYWLESETGGWNRARLTDPTGQSGSFLGQEIDIRMRHHVNHYVDWSLSYARFNPGDYTESFARSGTGPYTSEASNFFYFELSLNAFGDGKL
ncbi:MAG: alginate export family protein, partial [Methylicorpusculum sp.]|nr:alginate export family protein [Methylicorpusculum sp.]